MRFVIYDDETLEPITVISLTGWGWKDIEARGNRFRLAVHEQIPIRTNPPTEEEMACYQPIKTVDIWFERFRRGGQETWMCFTRQSELAMLLRPSWLPGQRSTVQELERMNKRLTAMFLSALARDI